LRALRLQRGEPDGQATAGSRPHERRRITPEGRVDDVEVDVEAVCLVGGCGDDADGLVMPVCERLADDGGSVERTRCERLHHAVELDLDSVGHGHAVAGADDVAAYVRPGVQQQRAVGGDCSH
jgi:hypothetical protein